MAAIRVFGRRSPKAEATPRVRALLAEESERLSAGRACARATRLDEAPHFTGECDQGDLLASVVRLMRPRGAARVTLRVRTDEALGDARWDEDAVRARS